MLTREQEQRIEQTLERLGDTEGLEYIQRLKDEVRSKVDYIREQDDVIEYYKHRAKVLEQALRDILIMLPCSVCPYGYGMNSWRRCNLDNGTCLENCLDIAEQELAKENNNA